MNEKISKEEEDVENDKGRVVFHVGSVFVSLTSRPLFVAAMNAADETKEHMVLYLLAQNDASFHLFLFVLYTVLVV